MAASRRKHLTAVLSRTAISVVLFLGAAFPPTAGGYTLKEPCTSSHDCPRGAFCRHHMSFRGECVILPKSPFGPIGPRQTEFPAEPEPLDQAAGSMPLLRCSDEKPCPAGYNCRTTGDSQLQASLCVPDSQPCWSTDDCSPADYCDKKNEDFDLTGFCRLREDGLDTAGAP
jgi:hypothetical protein